MPPVQPMSAGVRRVRRTAACARAALAVTALALILTAPSLDGDRRSPLWAIVGFAIILGTAGIQLPAPRSAILRVEESLAPVAALLIIGTGPARVSIVSLLWLVAVACGVLARGGRQHWLGRALLLFSLLLPWARDPGVNAGYIALCVASVALLLTCGRVTRELRSMLDQARWEADHDGLTSLLSRQAFRNRLDHVAADATGGPPSALLVVDLDHFGHINKSVGHAAGDAALVAVAERLHRISHPRGLAGRLGGDEFAAVVSGSDPEALAAGLLRELAPTVGVSIGVAHLGRDGHDAETLLRAGDVALRVCKRRGRGRVETYSGESLSDRGPGGARETLERLIRGDGITMVMQPIVDITHGHAHAYEALARFEAGTTSSPVHWFALADELGERDRLELACLEAALRCFDDRPPGSALSVNLSAPLLAHPRVGELLAERPDLDGLIIELTENSLVDDTPGLSAHIFALCARKVCFALDDMGVGYSGLKQLTTVRPQYLKLDRELISGIDADPDRAALVSAMLGYATHTGGRLVAEGVETEAELTTLRRLGVTLVQGFYTGRPAPPWPQVREPGPPTAPSESAGETAARPPSPVSG